MSAPVFKKTKVEQKIDLKEVFGVDFTGLRSLREALGEAILERIRARTQGGDGMSFGADGRGRPTTLKKPYSKEYSETLDFKAFGKNRGDVNLTLTGDMLGLMDIKRQEANSITIGWTDATENAKAYNHSVGDTVPRRPFFGISKTELREIKKDFKSEIRAAIKVKDTDGQRAFEERVAALLEKLSGPETSGIGAEGANGGQG